MTDPTVLQVYVKGTPRPQPRPRFVNGRAISTVSTPAKAYLAAVLAACKAVYAQCGRIKGPVYLVLYLWFDHGKHRERAGKPHTARPDADNVLKLWMDAAQKAGLIDDDSHVGAVLIRKTWSATAGALLTITPDGGFDTREDDNDLGVYPL